MKGEIPLTKHGFKLDQAADEVVKVNHLIVGIAGDQDLVQFVVEFKTYKQTRDNDCAKMCGIWSLQCN